MLHLSAKERTRCTPCCSRRTQPQPAHGVTVSRPRIGSSAGLELGRQALGYPQAGAHLVGDQARIIIGRIANPLIARGLLERARIIYKVSSCPTGPRIDPPGGFAAGTPGIKGNPSARRRHSRNRGSHA